MMTRLTVITGVAITLLSVFGCGTNEDEYVEFEHTTPVTDAKSVDSVAANESSASASGSSPESATATSQDIAAAAGTQASTVALQPVSKSSTQPESTDPAADVTIESSASSDVVTNAAATLTPQEIVSPQSGLTGLANTPSIDNAPPEEPLPIKLLVAQKRFRRERGTEAVRVSYDDIDLLKVLNMDPVPANARDYFPEWLEGLDGKSVRIRGFMFPVHVASGITTFTLARDNQICCFQRFPKVYDVILVKLADGESTDYIDQQSFDVEGTLRIDSTPDEIELPRLYRIENARVLN